MSLPQQPEITADDVRNAGHLLEQLIDRGAAEAVSAPAFDQLAAAKRETDPVKRLARMSQALKQGAKDARATQQRLQKARQDVGLDAEGRSFTPDALAELEALKDALKKKIRRRAEEELARTYPENPNAKKSRPPRRNRINI